MSCRSLPMLMAPVGLSLLLFACGNPPPDAASQATPETEPVTEQAALPEEGAESGGYEQIDRSSHADQGEQTRVDPVHAQQPALPRRPVPRQTATQAVGAGVQGDVGMFYDGLDRDGTWVRHPDYSYVWIPSRMGAGWRPYQEGRWIWTDDYGWYWDSEEPFAWAVYHYGRWDYDPDYGWFWVPGDTWAPAWVTWRVGGDSVGWAPIAPDRPGFAGGMPRRYAPPVAESWVFVDAPNFTAPDIAPYVRPTSRIGSSLEMAREFRTPRYERNRVVNFGAPPDEMRRYMRTPIETRQLVYVGNRDDMFDDVHGRRVGIYRPIIAGNEDYGPPRRLADVGQTRRVVVRQFAGPGPEQLYDAPSVELLDVLDRNERQGLVQERLNRRQAAADARIAALQRERAALIEERRRQAKKLEAKIETERQEARAERKRLREVARAQKEERAGKIKMQAPPAVGEAAKQAPAIPAAGPEQSAVAPAAPEPAPAKVEMQPAPAPIETAKPEPEPAAEPAPAVGAAEPVPAPTAPAQPAPAPAPMPAAEPASEPPPPLPQQAETPPIAEPLGAPEQAIDQDRGERKQRRHPIPEEAGLGAAETMGAPEDAPRKRKRPIEAAIPEQPVPGDSPAPADASPTPPAQAVQPAPPIPPQPAAELPSDPSAPIEVRKAKRGKPPEAPPAEAISGPPAEEQEPQAAQSPSDLVPPPPAE